MVREDQAHRSTGFSAGLGEDESIQFAGLAALVCGLNPLAALDCHDPVEMVALESAVEHAAKLRDAERQDLANKFGEVMSKVFS